jgi:hypothetical protein
MTRYLVETYLGREEGRERAEREQRARSAAQAAHVRFEHAIHVPEDEICFYVFEAPSSREVAIVAERAGLDPVRVVEAVSSGEENG